MTDIERAKGLLSEGATCVLVKGDAARISHDRGVAPLVALYDSGEDFSGFSAADKVVGRGAAFLYVLLGVCELYAGVLSAAAEEVLSAYGVAYSYATRVSRIINRRGDGICPFEMAVMAVKEPKEALAVIRKKQAELRLGVEK